jgi:hypothetical protein
MTTNSEQRDRGELPAVAMPRAMVNGLRSPSPSGPTDADVMPPTPPRRADLRLAIHESAHALASHFYGREVLLVSARPGLTFGGVTLSEPLALPEPDLMASTLRQPSETRTAYESAIVSRLVGPLAGWMLGPVTSGPEAVDACDTAAVATADALAALTPRHREMLTDREANPEPLTKDEDAAQTMTLALVGDLEEAAAHLSWMRVIAKRFVIEHAQMIRRVATELDRVQVLDSAAFMSIVNPPRQPEVHTVKLARKSANGNPKSDPDGRFVDVADGRQVRLLEPLTLQHEHVMIATRNFWGPLGPAREGSLWDDRSPTAKHHADKLRRPSDEERSGEAEREAHRIAVNTAEMASRKADNAAKDATRAAAAAAAALDAARGATS